jgi:hypothetical protein
MTVKTVQIPNSRLIEGEYYTFTLLKSISLGPDEEYYVMREPNGFKLLMPKKFYTRYGFDSGQQIICRVDKINCIGRVFLEPKHPYYVEGEKYNFDVIAVERYVDKGQGRAQNFVVRDVLGHEWQVPATSESLDKKQNASISCLVQRIKKGRLYLTLSFPD